MSLFNKVVIIGTGFIGGSLGLALKKRRLATQVIGLSRHSKNTRLAKEVGAIDNIGASLEVVADADLVIIATPVDTIIDFGIRISKIIKKDCIVIDVGSTKERIVSKLTTLLPNFLGCHPLAGSEKKGIANLQDGIFKGSICLITPTLKTNPHVLAKIKLFWRKLGAKVLTLSAKKHDQVLAFTSHLPHVVAFSLIAAIPNEFLKISSGGLKDTTRICASDELLWSQIFLQNRKNLLNAISSFQSQLAALKLALNKKDAQYLTKILIIAKSKRERLG